MSTRALVAFASIAAIVVAVLALGPLERDEHKHCAGGECCTVTLWEHPLYSRLEVNCEP